MTVPNPVLDPSERSLVLLDDLFAGPAETMVNVSEHVQVMTRRCAAAGSPVAMFNGGQEGEAISSTSLRALTAQIIMASLLHSEARSAMRRKRALQSRDDFPKAAVQAKRGECRVGAYSVSLVFWLRARAGEQMPQLQKADFAMLQQNWPFKAKSANLSGTLSTFFAAI